MKLLMISGDRMVLQGKQGAFWYTLEAFSKQWERVDVICPRVEIPNPKSQIPNFFGNVFFHPSPWSLLWQPKWIAQKGEELVKLHGHSVMTVHEYPPFYNGIGAYRLWKKTKIPYVLEIHHIVGHPIASTVTESVGRFLSRVYLAFDAKHAAGVRVVNRTVAQTLERWGVAASKIKVVPSAYLDPTLLSGRAEEPPRYDIAFAARLVANKGLLETLEAVAKVEGATLVVIGDGPEKKRAEELSRKLGIAHRVEFRGWLPSQQDLVRVMRSAKIFVMNSKSEGGPRSALEAMALGLPVISTKVGVMPEVIIDGQNALFTTGTPDDLAEKIKLLLSDVRLRESMGNRAREVLTQFDRERLIANYAHYLQSFR